MTVIEAEKRINAVLAQLETDNNGFVEGIDLNDIEVTSIASRGEMLSRTVRIRLRVRGAQWRQ